MAARTSAAPLVLVLASWLLAGGCDATSGRSPTAPGDPRPADGTPSRSTPPGGSMSSGLGPSGSPPAESPAPTGWQAGPEAPLALTEVAATAHDGRIWVAGGLAGDGRAVRDVLVLDPQAGRWFAGPALPTAVHHAALVSDGPDLWLLGGYEGDSFDRPTDRVLRLAGGAWVEEAPLPEPRAAGGAAWDGVGRLVYGGGVGPRGVRGTVWARDEMGWQHLGELPDGREHTAATSDGEGRVFLLGGRRGGLESNVAGVELVEPDGGLRRLGELPTPRGGVAALWWPGLGACLVGGESPDGTNGQAECLGLDGGVVVLPPLAHPRHGLGAAVVDGTAYALLGGERPGLFVSSIVETLALP